MKVAMWFAYLPDAERAANIRTLTKRQRADGRARVAGAPPRGARIKGKRLRMEGVIADEFSMR